MPLSLRPPPARHISLITPPRSSASSSFFKPGILHVLAPRRAVDARKQRRWLSVCLLVGSFTSQQHACVSQGRICSKNCPCCHTEIEVADQTFYLTQSQYTDGPTSPSADPNTPGAWQGSHWSANFWVTGMTRPGKIPSQAGFEPRIFRSRGGRLNH